MRLLSRFVGLPILSLGGSLAALQGVEAPTAPVAVLECEVPALPDFVVHGTVPLPPGYRFTRNQCPFTVLGPDGRSLPTQWEAVARRADGDLSVVEILAHTSRLDLTPGTRARFEVYAEPCSGDPLQIDPDNTLLQHLRLRTVDAAGNEYIGRPVFERVYRYGPVEFTGEWSVRLLPTDPGAPFAMEQLGAAQLWLTVRRDCNVVELSLNFHDGSSQHPAWHLYFEKLQLALPEGWAALSMWPEARAGEPSEVSGLTVVPLIERLPQGQMHFLEQRHERGFRYFLYFDNPANEHEAWELRGRRGWARAVSLPRGTEPSSRTWSFTNPATPGYFVQGLPMPDLDHVPALAQELIDRKRSLYQMLTSPISVGPGDPIYLDGAYRNPHGVPYGGMTGGTNMNLYEGMETLWTGERRGLLHAYAVMRCYNDRQPGAMYEDDGRSFRPDDPRYLNPDGTQPYRIYNNTFSTSYPDITHDAPWNWHAQDRSHETYLETHGMVAPYRDALLGFDPIDTQHFWRYSRMIKLLVWLDNDPLARRRMEAACELIRATYWDGPEGRLSDFLNGPSGIGAGVGREHAACADLCAAAYACGTDGWRARWKPWFETFVDVLDHVQAPSGVWQALTYGKAATSEPFGDGHTAFFRVCRSNEHAFLLHTLRGVKETVFAGGVDPQRYQRCHDMLVAASEAVWRLLWRWKPDGSGPDGHGTWDRVAVGTIGPNPVMFLGHADHPAEQFDPRVALDAYRTGLALTYWFAESSFVTGEMFQALETYLGTSDFLSAIQAEGVTNIWNNAALLALIQLNAP